ncbi:MOSC domain-containing protein [Streptomyces sp. WAC 00631]|uniref:MOSC domain-containing protein n=1 Tax=Streptomyces sp. WAC 00631 TaxID=2203201 RepID=UPI001E3A0C6A|nr:MOSC domain-containing protein [Streptomyces sp. WAC 00631]MCC5036761.1 MOSC domain-containing protein [Streptomyces sp. WAC 00631]
MNGTVAAVSREEEYRFSKRGRDAIRLLAGLGVEGDAHQGATVRHRSRMARDPAQPNLRQVHLLHRELFAEVAAAGFEVLPGQLGENITTAGIDLLALSTGTLLRLGDEAVVEVTGLRNPCAQIDGFRNGLLKEVLGRDERGRVVRRAGIMGIVLVGGEVRPGDRIMAEAPAGPHHPLEPV